MTLMTVSVYGFDAIKDEGCEFKFGWELTNVVKLNYSFDFVSHLSSIIEHRSTFRVISGFHCQLWFVRKDS